MCNKGLITGNDNKARCFWCGDDPIYMNYHDKEWGRPVYDDTRLFEKICLEGFQSGLSWITILRKRENFREAFNGFDFTKVANYDNVYIDKLLNNDGIIRHRGKIEATINNAQRAIDLAEEKGSLSNYFWSFKPKKSTAQPESAAQIQSKTEESIALSKDLKKRGWKFIGPTTTYAFMQAMGMVNDHIKGCHVQPLINR